MQCCYTSMASRSSKCDYPRVFPLNVAANSGRKRAGDEICRKMEATEKI